MKLHNTGSKIIHVGATMLMPGDSMNITAAQADTPAIKVLSNHGFLRIEEEVEEKKTVAVEEAEVAEEKPAAKPVKKAVKKATAE